MAQQRVVRAAVGAAAFGGLLATGAALTLVASARQSPPSPSQAKKTAASAPLSTQGKQTVLPGFGKPSDARGGPVGASASGRASKGDADVKFGQLEWDGKTNVIKGKDVVYTDGDVKVTGQTAVYNDNSKQLEAQGDLQIDDPKHHVSGDRSHVDRRKQMATIAGSVVITLKPTPLAPGAPTDTDAAKQRRYPIIITCDRAEDAYKKEFIVLNGHLVFKQTISKDDGKTVERTVTAEHAEYDGKLNKLHLFKPVNAFDSEGRTFDFTADVFVGTKENDEKMSTPGPVTVHFPSEDVAGEDPAAADKSAPPPAADKSAPPPPTDKGVPPPSSPKKSN